MEGTDEGEERQVDSDGEPWRVTVAWRGADGSGLCYFRPADDETSDREDRRARIPGDCDLGGMDTGELVELLEESAPLTRTERRFRAPDGRDWLAQNIGPVWADEEAAAGAQGVLFTALDGPGDRVRAAGGHVARMSVAELEDVWRRAVETDAGGKGGEDPDRGL